MRQDMDGERNSSTPGTGHTVPLKKRVSSAAEISQGAGGQLGGGNDPGAPGAHSKFGSRLLSAEQDVFEHNAWDHVEPDSKYLEFAEQQIRMHHEHPVPAEKQDLYNNTPAEFWNSFYNNNQNRFFKDRNWLRIEFSELFEWTTDRKSAGEEHADASTDKADVRLAADGSDHSQQLEVSSGAVSKCEEALSALAVPSETSDAKFRIMEVGCGAGNAVFPLLADIADPRLFVYACDYSKVAVDVVKSGAAYDSNRCAALVWDLSSTELPPDVQPGSIDIMLMVFVFSALHPSQWNQAVENAYRLLKPGGLLLFRDYGRNDLTQVRFKKSRLLEDNLYIRGDGTRVYFFTNDELAEIFGGKFAIEQNAIDRRLLVNRKLELKMYRVWLQAKFRKPINAD